MVKDSEHGAISVIMAIVMVVLLGFVAIVVDVGLLYAEKAQLQNGADASALGVAQACASRNSGTDCSPTSPLASRLSNENALDGHTRVSSVVVDTAQNRVTVTTGAQDENGENRVSLFFARALGVSSAEVNAVAKARWGSPKAGPTVFPAAFSVCQVQGSVDGSRQRLGLHGGTYANPSCNYGPSGQTVPGGFGWLSQTPDQCGGNIIANVAVSGTGNSAPSNCDAIFTQWKNDINAGRKPTVLLPVFDGTNGRNGANAKYNIKTFAAFAIEGWKFTGGDEAPDNLLTFHNTSMHVGAQACQGNCRGIIGTFVTYVSLAEAYTLGPVDQYGVRIIEMTD